MQNKANNGESKAKFDGCFYPAASFELRASSYELRATSYELNQVVWDLASAFEIQA
jgi:hypothetical protein